MATTIKGIKVGTSTITASYGGKTATATLKVTAQSLGSFATVDAVTYTGSAHTPTPAVYAPSSIGGAKLTPGTDYTLSYSSNTNAGTATIIATGKGNFTGTISTTFTIKSAAFTVSEPDQSYTYTGSAQGKAISVSDLKGSQTATIKYGTTSGSYTTTNALTYTTPGTYTVYWQVTAPNHTEQTGDYQIIISNADFTVTASDQSYTYTGSAQGKAISVSDLKGSQTATITYATSSTGTYSTTVPTITNVADTKTIYYKVTANYHNPKTGSYKLTITNKSISIPTPTSKTATYTGNNYSATFPAATGASITKYRHSTDNATWTESTSAVTRSIVGKTYVQAYYNANTNYKGSGWSSSATITISNADFTVTASDQSYTYTGSAQGKAISVSDLKGSQTATIKYGTAEGSYTTTTVPTYTDAGTYTVYYQVTATYHNTKTGSYKITIGKANPAFDLQGSTVVYHNTATVKAYATVVGKIYYGTTTSSMTTPVTVSAVGSSSDYNTTVFSKTDLGTTTIYAYFVPTDTTNYNSVGSSSSFSKSASAKVEQATDANISVTVTSSLVYTGSAQTIAKLASKEGVKSFTLGYTTSEAATVSNVVWAASNTTTVSATKPGTYYIWYKFEPDSNHSNTETGKKLTATCTIGYADITHSAKDLSYTYTGKAQGEKAVTVTTKGSQTATITYGTTSGSYTTTDVPTYTNAGTYTVYYKVTATYHNDATGSYKITIGKATQPMTIDPASKTIYNTIKYNTVTIKPSNAQGSVTYTSSNTSVATVSTAGVVTYVAAGTATITVTAAGNSNYNSGSKTCAITCTVDTKKTYGAITGTLTVSQKKELPAGGITLTTTNIGDYVSYDGSKLSQTITWVSGNTTTNSTFTYTWSGNNVSIASLETIATDTVTAKTVAFTITATGENSVTTNNTVKSLNQEINKVESLSLTLSSYSIKYGETSTPTVKATYTSGSIATVTASATYTSSDTTVATIQN